MNSTDRQSLSYSDAAIDRLVAGELDDTGRRELLLRLENDPEGWRRCALAFLEDQAWRQAFAQGLALPSRSATNMVVPVAHRRGVRWVGRAAMAATVLVSAFAAGLAVGGFSRPIPRVEIAKKHPVTAEPAPVAQPQVVREVGSIDLVDGSSGESPPQRIPILSGPGIDENWLREQPSAVPDYVRARWERQGYQVEERRKLVSITLDDGRRVSIPVDEVELGYVGQHPL